jgi:rhodanese-related sulfurtransferase
MPSLTTITTSQLARLIGTPAAPTIVDVCCDEDFAADQSLIPAAVRHPFDQLNLLLPELRGLKVIVVCEDGGVLSQGAAAMLRAQGVAAETLEGGRRAWREAGEIMIPAAKIPRPAGTAKSLWVTRQRPKIDRIACPWLIRRFVDARAQFLFVPPAEVLDVAEKFDATPFDVEDVFWSHRGNRCTFDTMIEEFGLGTEPLTRLADIVRGADTNRHEIAPQAAGLLAVSLGLSRMFRDDLDQLEAGMLIYDSLYRWARDAVDEGHDWPAAVNRR